MINNILKVYSQASPSDVKAGLEWYPEAKRECRNLARRNDISLSQAIGVVAALSPRVNWKRNVIAAENLIRGNKAEGFPANRNKAQAILEGGSPDEILGGNKVRSFYSNISRPASSTDVTIDRWAIRIALGEEEWKTRPNTPTAKQYLEIANSYREAAAIVGIKPLEMQAITWVTIKRITGVW